MKLRDDKRTFQAAGLQKTGKFTIAATAKAFRTLVASIYTDGVLAIVRELSTNAADAHADAGKPQAPFAVHLPTFDEPFFEVRDEGTGMPEDKVFGLYTTFFASDRTGSDEFGGQMGLGSKTPFSYSDQFSVESRYRGTLTTYAMFVDADGTPGVTKMASRPTAEPDGLTVRLPVKMKDNDLFFVKAQRALSVFRVRPVVTGRDDFTFDEVEYSLTGDGYGLCKSQRGHSRVLMGDVAYPVDLDQVTTDRPSEDEDEEPDDPARLFELLRWGIDLRVPIGAVEVTAGRDALNYDTPQTAAAVRAAAFAALADMAPRVADAVVTAPSLWQARLAFRKFRDGALYRLGLRMPDEVAWNGVPVSDVIDVKPHWPGVRVIYHRSRRADKRSLGPVVDRAEVEMVSAGDRDEYYWRDVTATAVARVRDHLKAGYAAADSHCKPAAYVVEGAPDAVRKFLDETGLAEVAKPVSSLPPPAPGGRSGSGHGKARCKLFLYDPDGRCGRASSTAWRTVAPPPAGGVYVTLDKFEPSGGFSGGGFWRLNDELNSLEAVTGARPAVYGVRDKDKAELARLSGWRTLRDFAVAAATAAAPGVRDRLTAAAVHDHLDVDLRHVTVNVHPPRTVLGKLGTALVAVNTAVNEDNEDTQKAAKLAKEVRKLAAYYHLTLYARDQEHSAAAAKKAAKALTARYQAVVKAVPILEAHSYEFSPSRVFGDETVAEFVQWAWRRARRAKALTSAETSA